VVRERLEALLIRKQGKIGIRCNDLLATSFLAWSSDRLRHVAEAQRALARRLVRGIFEELLRERLRLSAQHVEQVLGLATTPASGHRIELPGAVAERSFDWIWFAAFGAQGTQTETAPSKVKVTNMAFARDVVLDGKERLTVVAIPEIGACFRLKVIDGAALERETNLRGALDRDLLHPPLVLRNWQPGDSFQPEGRARVLKVKEFFRGQHISLRDRARWPVLASNGELAWARGGLVGPGFAAGRTTRAAVLIAEEEM
jgi:tRNA(Ile)-lysidine synthetase-like protein